ncbi:helix-turn-helix domain-containing protein [Tunicatimonas pelagia]|uniref:helix-turn-helix domain-containing protein n=1 Tax=Tunicatimonas pelagia TaxID=931531 RepID=UPI002666D944|nr:helix-turn-helix domain-containing protein [Tunicatimonas pelagia]WKN44890.1 helix-turn-helix domain-containing protein [Tunicatimonas pelagia]
MKLPSYDVLVPATVRYDQQLKPAAKLLYGEVLALSDRTGYCWATNQYFADLYGVNKKTISGWLSQLVNRNYLRITYEISQGNQRRIYPEKGGEKSYTPLSKNVSPLTENQKGVYEKSHRKTPSLLIENYSIDTIDRVGPINEKIFLENDEEKKRENGGKMTTEPESKPPGSQRPKRGKTPPFSKPSVAELENYLRQQKSLAEDVLTTRVLALRFFNYYESNGWKVGRNPMQNWQAAMDNWQLNAQTSAKSEPLNRLHSGGEKDYSIPL